jgi:hypothetical protein
VKVSRPDNSSKPVHWQSNRKQQEFLLSVARVEAKYKKIDWL